MSVINDRLALSINPYEYMPEHLRGREQELDKLRGICSEISEGRHYSLIVIGGGKGTGKTITIQHFLKIYAPKHPLEFIYLRGGSSIMKAIKLSCIPLFFGKTIPKTREDALTELIDTTKKNSIKKPLKHIILFIDDTQEFDIRNFSPILRFLWEHYTQLVTPALITNTTFHQLFSRIKEDVLSRYSFDISGKTIVFPPYSFFDSGNILRERASNALEPQSWDNETITLIAKHTITTGDIRSGIELLRTVAEKTPSGNKISVNEIEKTCEDATIKVIAGDLQSIPLIRRLYLLAVTICAVKTTKTVMGIPLAGVEATYSEIAKNIGLKPPGRTTRWKIREELKHSLNIINTRTFGYRIPTDSGRAGRGKATFLKLREKPRTLLLAMRKVKWDELWDDGIQKIKNLIDNTLSTA